MENPCKPGKTPTGKNGRCVNAKTEKESKSVKSPTGKTGKRVKTKTTATRKKSPAIIKKSPVIIKKSPVISYKSPSINDKEILVRRQIHQFMDNLDDYDFFSKKEIEEIVRIAVQKNLSHDQIERGLNEHPKGYGVFA